MIHTEVVVPKNGGSSWVYFAKRLSLLQMFSWRLRGISLLKMFNGISKLRLVVHSPVSWYFDKCVASLQPHSPYTVSRLVFLQMTSDRFSLAVVEQVYTYNQTTTQSLHIQEWYALQVDMDKAQKNSTVVHIDFKLARLTLWGTNYATLTFNSK